MCSVTSFVIANFFINNLTQLGPSGCYYYNSGAFALTAGYFIAHYFKFNYSDEDFVSAE